MAFSQSFCLQHMFVFDLIFNAVKLTPTSNNSNILVYILENLDSFTPCLVSYFSLTNNSCSSSSISIV